MEINTLLRKVIDRGAASVHIAVGLPPMLDIDGKISPTDFEIVNSQDAERLSHDLMDKAQRRRFEQENSVSFPFTYQDLGRFRVTIFRQRGLIGAILKLIPKSIPNIDELGLPPIVKKLVYRRRGLILVTGPADCGKTTTLAAMVGLINSQRNCHILTLEDPIEYTHEHKNSIISQRQIGVDSLSFSQALREALRQDCDIIMLGEMRDLETIQTAITAAETGRLVLATMHTVDAVQTINRIIDVFPPHQHQQIRTQLALTLEAVIAQQLLMRRDRKGRIPVTEIMVVTTSIRNLIRGGRSHQIYSDIETGREFGMQTLDQALEGLLKKDIITELEVLTRATQPFKMAKRMEERITVPTAPEVPAPSIGLEPPVKPLPTVPRPSYLEFIFQDVGAEPILIDRKLIQYRADFTAENLGYWTTSGSVSIEDGALLYVPGPWPTTRRSYMSDFSILSGKESPFPLPGHLLFRYKVIEDSATAEQTDYIYFKIYSSAREAKGSHYDKIMLEIPINKDRNWHTLSINLPLRDIGKLVKSYIIELSSQSLSISISDIVFF